LQHLLSKGGRWNTYRPRNKAMYGDTLYYECTRCGSSFGDPTSCATTMRFHVYRVHRQGFPC
jgi:hypothetical protein